MKKQSPSAIVNNQRGVSAVVIGICLFMLVGFIALAIDVGHLYVVRNELQNAADAGALAGARHLYKEGIFEIDPNANSFGEQAATANIGDNKNVEVIFDPAAPQEDDVQRGHWSFNTRTFTRSDGLIPPPIWGKTADELDAMIEWVNAVQVIGRRESLPITSFFAGIFGYTGFKASRKAVAYLGASSAWFTADFDEPIAICAQSLVPPDKDWEDYLGCIQGEVSEDCELDCNIGRMLNSGSKTETHNTAGWTNFSGGTWPDGTEDTCSTATASEMTDLVCDTSCDSITCGNDVDVSNPDYDFCCKQFVNGDQIGATGGVQQVTLDKFRDCWVNGTNCDVNEEDETFCWDIDEDPHEPDTDRWGMNAPDEPWGMTLPVVNCPGNNVSNCPTLVGIAEVSLVWITRAGTPDPSLDTPYKMRSTKTKEGCGNAKPGWPTNESLDEATPPTYDQMLSFLETTGFPSKYYDDIPVSCPPPLVPEPGIPSNIPGLQGDATLSTTLDSLLASLPVSFINNLELERIAPTDITSPLASDIQLFDIKDPGDPAPNKPDNICSTAEYEQLLLHHLADAAGEARWASFVRHFDLKNWDDAYAPLAKKSIYFLPTCCGVEPHGISGDGGLFGIMAKVPVLVD
jgi:hypothetical protein